MNLRNKYIVFLLCLASASAFGQTKKAWLEAAALAVEDKNFHFATNYFGEALAFDTTDLSVINASADAARQFNAYTYAANNYAKVVELDDNGSYPMAQYHLAEMYQKLGKYEDAKRQYELYLSENNGDDVYYSQRANKEIEACDWAIGKVDDVLDYYKVENMGAEVNTPYSEFGANKVDGELFYSSLRFDRQLEDAEVERKVSKILKMDAEGLNGVLEGDINSANSLVAHTAFNMNKTRVYYTLCEYSNSYDIRCDLYYKPIDDEGNFGESKRLPAPINADGATNTQPNLGFDPESGREILYFVSDRDGGKGKLDVWYSIVESDMDFADPVNLSQINTAENEVSPYFHTDSKSIYFSSDGYLGFGGLDVFRADVTEDQNFVNIENMGSPVNSSYNDLYYSLNKDGNEAFMSSNRIGSQYLENQVEACCYDIYRVEIEEFDVIFNALTFNKLTGDSLVNTTVRVIDAATNEEVAIITNPDDNDHIFTLPSQREYIVIAERQGFSSDTVSLSTKNIKKGETITKKLYLEPEITILDIFTFDADNDNADLTGVTIILENLDDPSKTDVIRLNELGNDFNFELDPCTKYRITAFKDGYESQSFMIDTCDPNNQGVIRKDLFMSKPNLNIYLPVTLYFDNDHPDPRSRNMYTLLNYSDTYYPYYSKKEEFKTKASAGLSGDLQYSASQNLEYFFEDKVKGEYNKMQIFLDKLLERLRNGDSFEVAIKGFASPKSTNKYNLALGQRRVYSLRNELQDFASGAFDQYLANGTLVLTDVSYGEELAPTGVSDSNTNTRKSIYSVDASQERRAQIVSVRKLN